MIPPKFRYLLDPLFLFSISLYAINKWILTGVDFWRSYFTNYHLNDLLLLPVMVPIILFASKKVGLRQNDNPPVLYEIALPLIIWIVAFEIVAPFMFGSGTADLYDVLAYLGGGIVSWLFWNRWLVKPA